LTPQLCARLRAGINHFSGTSFGVPASSYDGGASSGGAEVSPPPYCLQYSCLSRLASSSLLLLPPVSTRENGGRAPSVPLLETVDGAGDPETAILLSPEGAGEPAAVATGVKPGGVSGTLALLLLLMLSLSLFLSVRSDPVKGPPVPTKGAPVSATVGSAGGTVGNSGMSLVGGSVVFRGLLADEEEEVIGAGRGIVAGAAGVCGVSIGDRLRFLTMLSDPARKSEFFVGDAAADEANEEVIVD
jgi:hypothetical protein